MRYKILDAKMSQNVQNEFIDGWMLKCYLILWVQAIHFCQITYFFCIVRRIILLVKNFRQPRAGK